MSLYIGVDLGTSAMKLLLIDNNGHQLAEVTREYPLEFPRPGWSQQHPAHWRQALMEGIPELLQGQDASLVEGIGVAGQMHGLVVLDAQDEVIRPAILWNDGRTAAQTAWLNEEIGAKQLIDWTANIAFAGFTAPKLLWLRQEEPENFARISRIMLPKDYINYLLTGVHACDYSDASGMLLLDVRNKRWRQEMLDVCGVTEEQMPLLYESSDCIGTVLPAMAKALGLPEGVRVAAGAGDNAAAAIGCGVIGQGGCNISLGTSGTLFVSSARFATDDHCALHAFAHADGGYHLMGCILSAASCNKWLMESILRTDDYAAEQAPITDDMLGRNHVFFLPYLMGERSPINDVNARGCFIGMTMDTSRAELTQAVLEGVAFALRDCIEVARALGVEVNTSRICGGGAKSALWRRIIANVLNVTLQSPAIEQGPGFGGAILAMTACGAYADVTEACEALVSIREETEPEPELVARYNDRYARFRQIYPAMKPLFETLSED